MLTQNNATRMSLFSPRMDYNKSFHTTVLSVLLLLLASSARIPIGVVPVTLQTFVVFLLGLTLDKYSAINTGIAFVSIKLVTLPFLFCPSFGYIIGMGFTIPIMYYVRQITRSSILNCLIGYCVTNSFGAIWLFYFLSNWKMVWLYGLEPFVLVEIFKATIAIYTSKHLEQRINNSALL